jgi:hypothetical protein
VTQAFSSSSKQNFNFYLEGNDEASGFFIYLFTFFFFSFAFVLAVANLPGLDIYFPRFPV